MRILLTGASGFVGGYLLRDLSQHHAVIVALHNSRPKLKVKEEVQLDLLEPQQGARIVTDIAPDVVVHAAALVDADRCEREPGMARRMNVEATAELAAAAAGCGAAFIGMSTDLVFDGAIAMAREIDPARPMSVYGRTKVEAEQAAAAAHPGALMLRLALVYGVGLSRPAGFMERLIRQCLAGVPMKLFTDQFRTPLYVDDIPGAVRLALARNASGVHHLSGGERLSRYDFGMIAARAFGFSPDLCVPVQLADLPLDANRPVDCSLDPSQFIELTQWKPRGPEEGLRAMRMEWEEQQR